ncbi:MAG TPA: monovalent cation/H+ antiporter subunit A [Polyangia bacterium]|jgi:multicomponent K+:H+ antiporter subunit A|nr:monovalent cation/H+ antiporter subunit A [Polyangia bacterium]
MPLAAVLLLFAIAALVVALLPARARTGVAALAGASALAGLIALAIRFPEVRDGGVAVQRIAWVPSMGLDLVLRLDGLTWMFGVLVTGIGALVVLYARYYLSPADPVPRFYAFLLGFIAAMLGTVFSGNLLQLAFFWELTSLLSFLLIGYWTQSRGARRGARMALTVTGMGGLCLLAGVIVLGHIAGSYDLARVLASADRVKEHGLYPLALCLILLGAFTKSAQVPLHFWLPNAMAAPTPVSAYLHSATMVKLGIFLLARLWPALSGTELWFWLVGSAGLATLLWGAWVALFRNDLKAVLAYSTISHLGLIVLLLGLNSPLAAVAAVFHLMNHATFKASLFMAVGIIDHETGTRDLRRLSGLFRLMPFTGTLALVATAAMAGVPLLNGFLSKEMFFAEAVFVDAVPAIKWGLAVAATLAGMGSVAYSLRFGLGVFFGPAAARDTPRVPEEPPRWMRVPVDVLVLACLVVGIAPAPSIGPLLAAAARPVVGGPLPAYSLKLWHGFTAPFLMSVLAMVGGTALYLAHRRFGDRLAKVGRRAMSRIEGDVLYTSGLAWLSAFSDRIRRGLMTAGLQRQMAAVVLVAVFVSALTLRRGVGTGDRPHMPLSPIFIGLWGVGMIGSVGAAWQAKFHRLAALMLAGVTGAVTSVTFIWFSAPDLALTQLTVEVMTTLLILVALRWLPAREPSRGVYNQRTKRAAFRRRGRDLVIALAAGGGTAVLAYAVMTRDLPERTSFFLEQALSGGGGRNVVNVMLVDFRGFDTFGEGVVLSLVALTVYALLRRFRPAPEVLMLPPQQHAVRDRNGTDLVSPRSARGGELVYLLIPRTLAPFFLASAGVAATFFFLRGHNAPGGGFVAGLVMAIGLLLQYIAFGTDWVEDRVRLAPRALIGAGLLLVLGTSAGALAVGYPLLTSHTFHFKVPLVGEVHLGSAMFFDLGVFCEVLGSTLLIITSLAHQSIRAHRIKGEG